MKNRILSFLLVIMALFIVNDLAAQSSDRPAPQRRTFGQSLWYGGSVNLGFSGGSFFGTSSSTFQFGLAPMVGFKIFDEFSIGPRVSLNYLSYTTRINGNRQNVDPLSWSVGLFSRYKIPVNQFNLFVHMELEFENQALVGFNGLDLDVVRREVGNTYIGGGYSSGYPFAYEILILYNLNYRESPFINDTPFDIRFGVTYKF